jgi:hypothetical protein
MPVKALIVGYEDAGLCLKTAAAATSPHDVVQ